MKTIILLGILGATMSAPFIPQRKCFVPFVSSQGPFNPWIPPFPGILQQQQQAQIPGLSRFSLSTLDWFAGLVPNQIPFPGRVSFAQETQAGQLDPSQPQTPLQTQQGPNNVMPSVFSFKMPHEQGQMPLYYPVYVLLPWEQPQETVAQSPPQTGQLLFEEQVPQVFDFSLTRQQPPTFDPFLGTAPEIAVMPAGGASPYLQKEMINFKHTNAEIFIPSTSQKPSTTNFFTSAMDPTITPELMEKKAKTNSLKEP
uniref:Odontogenic ameloblast-associated protein n=1 Tax=Balaenoptera musculus TaxID=9771 RepID=A0A8C0HZY2_BALMU